MLPGRLLALRGGDALGIAGPVGHRQFDPAARAITDLVHSLIESCADRPRTRFDWLG
jgi:hypothetical protein